MNENEREMTDLQIRATRMNYKNKRRRTSRLWTIRSYLILSCLIVLSQSMILSGYIGSIVSSLERYYGFSTSRLGVAFSSYDIMGAFSIPLVSYFGSQNNRPRIVAFGAFLFVIGNILFILPYLVNGYEKETIVVTTTKNSSNQIIDHLCQSNSSNEIFNSNDLCSLLSTDHILSHLTPNLIHNHRSYAYSIPKPMWTYYILILSMIIMSIGVSPFYTLGITFLTDHLKKDDQAICTNQTQIN